MPLVTKDLVPIIVKTGASARVAEDVAPNFKVGDRVRARNLTRRHTRVCRVMCAASSARSSSITVFS